MHLKDLDIIVTAPPAPGWGGRYWILVKVTTDTGIVGWGECYASSVGPDAMRAVIEDVFRPPHGGGKPREHRAHVPPRLFLRLHTAPRFNRDGRVLRP